MRVVSYACLACNARFKKSVIEKEEAEDALRRGVNVVPVQCPGCGSLNVRYD